MNNNKHMCLICGKPKSTNKLVCNQCATRIENNKKGGKA